MSRDLLTKLALLNAMDSCQEYSGDKAERNRRLLILACQYMEFRDPLLRHVSLSSDPGERKREATALLRVKKNRKIKGK